MKLLYTLIFILCSNSALAISTTELKDYLSSNPDVLVKAGEGLYNQEAANSCLYCHGTPEQAGKIAAAAKMYEPKTWKIYKILGGDAAYAANKEEFLAKMRTATYNIILKGSVSHNITFKEPWFDVSKGGGAYDSQMVGLAGAPSKMWIKRYAKERGMTPEVAVNAVYEYIKTMDKQGVF